MRIEKTRVVRKVWGNNILVIQSSQLLMTDDCMHVEGIKLVKSIMNYSF